MVRLAIPLIAAAVVFVVYAIVDCAFLDRLRIRGLSRGWWIVVIVLVPVIGAALWFLIGRGRAHRKRGSGPSAPDDDIEFLRSLRDDAAQEDRIRRMEQELADLDANDDTSTGSHDTDATHDTRSSDDPDAPDESSGRPGA